MTSVVIGVYNGAALLRRTLDSVYLQDSSEFEVVVVDDGSTDGTGEVLNSFADRPNFRTLRLSQNGGLTRALIAGVAASNGDYVARIDAGDLMAPDRLRRQAELLDRRPEVGVVTCLCDVEVRVGGETVSRFQNHVAGTHEEVVQMLPYRTPFAHVAATFRKSTYDAVGGYDPSLSTTQDYDLWIRMSRKARFDVIPEVMTTVIYDNESSITVGRNKAQILNGLRIKLRAVRRGDLPAFPTLLTLPKHLVMYALPLRANQVVRDTYRGLKRRRIKP